MDSSESENMITELCARIHITHNYYIPADFDVDGDGILNNQ